MNHSQSLNSSDTFMLATRRSDPTTIATLLNQALNPQGIFARVSSYGNHLGILLESISVPDQDEMMAVICHLIDGLESDSIRFIKIAGYQSGQNVPAWYEEIERGKPLPIAAPLADSVESWLNQGLAAIDHDQVHPRSSISLSHPSAQSGVQPISSSNSERFDRTIDSLDEHRFLRFSIRDQETALLSLSRIQQVLKVPVIEILPVPHMPDCVLGIYNWRGEMVWLVDLAQQLGLASPLIEVRASEILNTIAIQTDHTTLGIVVAQVDEIETYSLQQLQPPTTGLFSAKFLSCMQGYFVSACSPVLNAEALIQDSLLQVHCSR